MPQRLDRVCRDYLLMRPWQALAFVVVLGLAGAAIGLAFPKWSAEGLLETPGVVVPFEMRRDSVSENERPEPKTKYVTLAEYRKMAAAYTSGVALEEYLTATKKNGPAVERLRLQADLPGFWSAAMSPVLPFSRQDAREFGDLKDAASDSLVGIDLVASARTPELSREMLHLLGGYLSNALIRERIRAWILKNSGEAPARQKALSAEVVEGQMRIAATSARIQDLKAILVRYPDASKLDSRQVVAITEGSDRFLSPLAQLVAAESSIAKLKETIARKEREARQFDLLQRYFAQAETNLQSTWLVSEMIPVLSAATTASYEGIDANADWAREVSYRLQADVAGFASALASYGFRNQARITASGLRSPVRLAFLMSFGGLILLALIAFVRASLRASRLDDEPASA